MGTPLIKKKYNIDIINNILKEKGCVLLTKEYININQTIEYICKCGRVTKKNLRDYLRSPGYCSICNKEIAIEKIRYNFENIKKDFEGNGCILLSCKDDYKNRNSPLKFICSCGRIDFISHCSFLLGGRCKHCQKEKRIKTNMEKYGVEYPIQLDEFKEKQRISLYKNNSAPCSKQQFYLYKMLGGKLNFPVNKLSLDIAFPTNKICIEYNGSGHDLQVQLGYINEQQFQRKEMNRKYFLLNNGWKVITIISKKDKVPTKSLLLDMMKFSKDCFDKNMSWINFDIDNNMVKTSTFKNMYNYNNLFYLKNIDIDSLSGGENLDNFAIGVR